MNLSSLVELPVEGVSSVNLFVTLVPDGLATSEIVEKVVYPVF